MIPPVVTWLRDPVERVISNFYYLQKILKELLAEEENDLDILSKMQKTLVEYASARKARNRMSKFLEGIELRQMLFVGISEVYDDDLSDLAGMLGWPGFEPCRHNITGGDKLKVSEAIREEIRRLNLEDVELYERGASPEGKAAKGLSGSRMTEYAPHLLRREQQSPITSDPLSPVCESGLEPNQANGYQL